MAQPSSATGTGVALVTGASSGIGAGYADRLARRGYDLILVARDEARLEALAARLRAETGVAVEVMRADLSDRDDLKRVEARLQTDDKIDFLVNNAGIATFARFVDSEIENLQPLIDLNVVAVTVLTHAAAKAFVARGRGTIVNISSALGLFPEYRLVLYGATKAYILYLTQSLHEEISGSGVRVQAVLPGAVRTEIWERSGGSKDNLDPSRTMDVEEFVDSSLAGLDQGEVVTINCLPDMADWDAFQDARRKIQPNVSSDRPAARYGLDGDAAVHQNPLEPASAEAPAFTSGGFRK